MWWSRKEQIRGRKEGKEEEWQSGEDDNKGWSSDGEEYRRGQSGKWEDSNIVISSDLRGGMMFTLVM